MSATAPLPLRRLRPARPLDLRALRSTPPRQPGRTLSRLRVQLADGAWTTLHVATYDRARWGLRVAALARAVPLVQWCAEQGVGDAVVGGFFQRSRGLPLGELHVDGRAVYGIPFDPPWGARRACVRVTGERVLIGRRPDLDAGAGGDLLQAGPLLLRDGVPVPDDDDHEGFSAGSHQFDSDITAGRYPRAALGCDEDRLIAVAGDGRTRRDAGMTLEELALALAALGARDALNLDGGGSASLVCGGRLRNRPREEHGVDLLGGRPIRTALTFQPRG